MSNKPKTLAELEAERPEDFRNPSQTEAEYQAQRARTKAKHDKEAATCPLDTAPEEQDEDEES